MAITRRTAAFAHPVALVEAELERLGVTIPPHVVDAMLNQRLNTAAEFMRVEPRWFLAQYVEDDAAPSVAVDFAAMWEQMKGLSVVEDPQE